MKIGKNIGTVTLARCHPSISGATLRLVEPIVSADEFVRDASSSGDKTTSPSGEMTSSPSGDTIVAWDLCSTGVGDWVAIAEGPESAAPFKPDVKPIDASIVALVEPNR